MMIVMRVVAARDQIFCRVKHHARAAIFVEQADVDDDLSGEWNLQSRAQVIDVRRACGIVHRDKIIGIDAIGEDGDAVRRNLKSCTSPCAALIELVKM